MLLPLAQSHTDPKVKHLNLTASCMPSAKLHCSSTWREGTLRAAPIHPQPPGTLATPGLQILYTHQLTTKRSHPASLCPLQPPPHLNHSSQRSHTFNGTFVLRHNLTPQTCHPHSEHPQGWCSERAHLQTPAGSSPRPGYLTLSFMSCLHDSEGTGSSRLATLGRPATFLPPIICTSNLTKSQVPL